MSRPAAHRCRQWREACYGGGCSTAMRRGGAVAVAAGQIGGASTTAAGPPGCVSGAYTSYVHGRARQRPLSCPPAPLLRPVCSPHIAARPHQLPSRGCHLPADASAAESERLMELLMPLVAVARSKASRQVGRHLPGAAASCAGARKVGGCHCDRCSMRALCLYVRLPSRLPMDMCAHLLQCWEGGGWRGSVLAPMVCT